MTKTSRAAVILAFLVGCPAIADEPTPAITIRVVKPGSQVEGIIDLFDGAKAPHPAAALAAWKRASRESNRLGKPLEALIASINPRMVEEVKTLEGAEVSIRFDRESGRTVWAAILPDDDGSFSALATALVLSGGEAEAPMGDLAVDRLGEPGSALMAKDRRGTMLAGDREGLRWAGERLDMPRDGDDIEPLRPGALEGLNVWIEAGALKASKSLAVRRVAEMLRPSQGPLREGAGSSSLHASLAGSSFLGSFSYYGPMSVELPAIDPTWLDWIPADRAMAGAAFSTDPRAKSWDALFGLADRVERLDPARDQMASIQVRLDLLARLIGVRSEADVLLHLKGVSCWVGSDGKSADGALVALHLDDQAAAERLAARVKPVPGSGPVPPPEAGLPRSLGRVGGRSLRISRVDRSVVLAWGEGVLEASLLARDNPDRSAGTRLRKLWRPQFPPSFNGGLWPGRVPGVWAEGSPLAKALADAPPVSWQGGPRGRSSYLMIVAWPDLDATVKRFLELIPLDPPPDR